MGSTDGVLRGKYLTPSDYIKLWRDLILVINSIHEALDQKRRNYT